MTKMHYVNLKSLDLNLLLVFEALMLEGSVTQAGTRLNLTQGAVSHALARLRAALDDELFVRTRRGMQPTTRALDLLPPIQRALAGLDAAFSPLNFDPGHASHIYRIASTDYFSTLILPDVIKRIQNEAPNVELEILPNEITNVDALFENYEIDFAIGFFVNELRTMLPPHTEWMTLTEDRLVCAMRRDHPLAGQEISEADYLGAKHLKYQSGPGSRSSVDQYLGARRLIRKIGLTVPNYLSAPIILESTDMIMTLPARLADLFIRKFDIVATTVPFSMPAAPTQLVWRTKFERHPAQVWLREILRDAARML